MFEFIHLGLLCVTLLMLIVAFASHSNQDKEDKNYFMVGTTTLLFAYVIFIAPYLSFNNAKTNIQLFENNKTLECKSSTGPHSSQKYLVAQKDWEIKELNFIKKDGGLIIRADNCE